MDINQIKKYIINFRRRISGYLLQDMAMKCDVYPISSGGAVLVFTVSKDVETYNDYKDMSENAGLVLEKIEQNAFGGNLAGITFSGTNLITNKNMIIIIKDENSSEWSDEAAEKDVNKILSRGN